MKLKPSSFEHRNFSRGEENIRMSMDLENASAF